MQGTLPRFKRQLEHLVESRPLTSVLRQLAAVDLVLHHICPIEGVLAEVEVQGDGVPQARHQDTELPLVEVNTPDLMTIGEDDKRLEGV